MSARDRLQSARANFRTGNYAEALIDHIWFHENALTETPSLSGVRLSYALSDWVSLGAKYPPALEALKEKRSATATLLLEGTLGKSAFSDIAAIDGYLQASGSTYEFFRCLLAKQPDLAKQCARNALPSIVEAGDFQLAARFLPDADIWIKTRSEILNFRVRMLKHEKFCRAPTRWVYVLNHVEDIQLFLRTKIGNGEAQEATRLKALAISLVESPSLRREVEACFVKPLRPPPFRR